MTDGRMRVMPLMRERSKVELKERDGLLDKVRPHVSRPGNLMLFLKHDGAGR